METDWHERIGVVLLNIINKSCTPTLKTGADKNFYHAIRILAAKGLQLCSK